MLPKVLLFEFVRPSSVRPSSVRPKANFDQTLVEWSLGGPLPKLCPTTPTSEQNGRQAKNRTKGGMKF